MNNKILETSPQIKAALDSCTSINKLDKKQISSLITDISDLLAGDVSNMELETCLKLHLGLGDACAKIGDFERSKKAYEASLQMCKNVDDKSFKVKAVNGICILSAIRSDYLKAIEGWINLLTEITDTKTQADIYNNLGISYSMTDRHREALECQYQCLKIDEELGRETETATDFFNLASSYMKLKQFDKSLELYNKAALSFENTKNYRYLSFAYSNLSMVYDDLSKFDLALDYANKSLELKKSFANDLEIGNTYANMGNILYRQKKFSPALEYFHKARILFEEGDDKIALSGMLVKLAWLSYDTNETAIAEEYGLKAYELATEINSLHVIQGSSKFLSKLYAKQNKFELAYQYLHKSTKMYSLILEDNPKILIAKSEADYYRKKIEEQSEIYRQRNIELTNLNTLISEQSTLLNMVNADLENSNALMHKLFSVISHDVRGPVLASVQFLNMIQMKDFPEEETDDLLKELTLSLSNTGNLLSDMLSWSNKQQHYLNQIEKLNIVPIVNDCINMYKSSALLKSMNLKYEGEPEVLAMAEKNCLHTIVRNLIHNAIKFTPEKGSVTVRIRQEHDKVRIEIIDTGIGISARGMENLLLGTPELKQGTNAESGTGFGIGLCNTYVKQLQGKIMVTSKLGEGSTFTVILNAEEQPTTE